MKNSKTTLLTFAQRCKNILASNWIGTLNTVKADAKGSKENIHSSKAMYMIRKGRPYIWVPEKDPHVVNTIIDERGSFAVASPFPGPLGNLYRSMEKLPPRVALTGDVSRLSDEKAEIAVEKLREEILAEQEVIEHFGCTVSNVLRSSNLEHTSRNQHLEEFLEGDDEHGMYKFDVRSCMFVDCKGGVHEIKTEEFSNSKSDTIAPFSAALIDGINQSDARRRALVLFCLVYRNANVKDVYILSADCKGFDLVGKLPSLTVNDDGIREYQWKEFRFTLKNEAANIGAFCQELMEMEEEVVKKVSSYSGLC